MSTPEAQLVSLCTGYGAVPSRIPTVAPFLQHLPATQHAHESLSANGPIGWEHAARDLLICVTKPGGAAGFNARTARFVRACLALDGSMSSYAQRMDDHANDTEFDYPTSRNTQTKLRDQKMDELAAKLLELTKYPCSPSRVEEAIRTSLGLIEVVKAQILTDADADELARYIEGMTHGLVNASAFFERHDPGLSPERRLNIIVTAVAARPYRLLYDELKPRSIDLLVPPDEVWKLFEGRPSLFDSESPETERTMQLVERIILDAEERDGWESTLLATATAEEDGGLTQQQALRLRAYFERLTD